MPIGARRVLHVNLNCSDLATSLRFWRIAVGLAPQFHTAPDPQDCAALGLGLGQWDAWLLGDDRGFDGVLLDLLCWEQPVTTGRPLGASETGWHRLVFESTDLDAVVERTGAHVVASTEAGGRFAFGTDPDGVAIAFVEGPHDRFATVTLNVADLDGALSFYRDRLGFAPRGDPRVVAGGRSPTTVVVLDDPRGDGSFGVELIQRAGIAPGSPRRASDCGLFRLALLTGSLDDDVAELGSAGAPPVAPPAVLDMGDDLPAVRVACVRGPAGECIELIEDPGP